LIVIMLKHPHAEMLQGPVGTRQQIVATLEVLLQDLVHPIQSTMFLVHLNLLDVL
jgi:hypothetical protein